MIVCPKCGAKIIIYTKFCPECGEKILNQNENVKINTRTEKPLAKRNKPQKVSKYSVIYILDTITNISIFLYIASFVSIIISPIVVLIDPKLPHIPSDIMVNSIILSFALLGISVIISDKLKRHIRIKIMKTGITAQARIISVKNGEYDYYEKTRTAELILEVDPETDAPYKATSTVKACARDASLVFRPGSTVQVFIDPDDASHVEVKYKRNSKKNRARNY